MYLKKAKNQRFRLLVALFRKYHGLKNSITRYVKKSGLAVNIFFEFPHTCAYLCRLRIFEQPLKSGHK